MRLCLGPILALREMLRGGCGFGEEPKIPHRKASCTQADPKHPSQSVERTSSRARVEDRELHQTTRRACSGLAPPGTVQTVTDLVFLDTRCRHANGLTWLPTPFPSYLYE